MYICIHTYIYMGGKKPQLNGTEIPSNSEEWRFMFPAFFFSYLPVTMENFIAEDKGKILLPKGHVGTLQNHHFTLQA